MSALHRFHCHVCGAEALVLIAGFESLGRATSDCRPWPPGGTVGLCEACGTVQRRLDAAWRADAAKIYGQYEAYRQSRAGQEQAVFDPASGAPTTRSRSILESLRASGHLPASGRMVDVGCGNGAMLRAFAAVLPGWQLNGYEPYGGAPERLRAIPGFADFWDGALDEMAGPFDVMTMSHSLEHIEGPIVYLAALREKLSQQGRLLIQVPYFPDNPFDLIVADHCSHFTLASLGGILRAAGYAPVLARTDIVAKEITVMARKASGPPSLRMASAPDLPAARAALTAAAAWLHGVKAEAEQAAAQAANFGMFGTSIGGNWLLGELGERIAFFVDEDPARVGSLYEGRPVMAPADLAGGATVFMALPPAIARHIVARLGRADVDFRLPPAYTNTASEPAFKV
ncbi:MAG: class I SAM-dependent methyltransferase [Alphaproteobacteria bacterium]